MNRAAVLAVPGDLARRTGGYGYARRVLAEAKAMDWDLAHLALPDGFPFPDAAALAETARRLAAVPEGTVTIVDGLAYGALPLDALPAAGPLVALVHHPLCDETGLGEAEAGRLYQCEREALSRAGRVVTSSRTTAERLVSGFGVSPAKLSVALPGTDPAPEARGSEGPGVSILSVGSLTPRKGHDLLIRALTGLMDLDWTCTIVGEAGDRQTALRLAEMAAPLGGRVALAGAMDRAALDAAYDSSDLFVLASRHEGFGMAYAEAMARALPVIGTTAGAIPEATGGGALLVPPDDAEALAEALSLMIRDRDERDRWRARAREAAAALPGWADTAAAIREAVESLA